MPKITYTLSVEVNTDQDTTDQDTKAAIGRTLYEGMDANTGDGETVTLKSLTVTPEPETTDITHLIVTEPTDTPQY